MDHLFSLPIYFLRETRRKCKKKDPVKLFIQSASYFERCGLLDQLIFVHLTGKISVFLCLSVVFQWFEVGRGQTEKVDIIV